MTKKIVLGTRGSDLALVQARMVEQALQARWSGLEIETKIIKTRGDERKGDFGLPEMRAGRKGLFTAEIERAVITGAVDLAVHSAKDLPSALSPSTKVAGVLPRAALEDLLITPGPHDLHSLPLDAIVATGSVRRKHQLHWKRPDLEVVDVRGNVPTRLAKLATSEWHAMVLARAGVERLGATFHEGRFTFRAHEFYATPLPLETFTPAGGQGIIALQIRSDDENTNLLIEAINHLDTRLCLRAEREFLRLLQADCDQPVGVLAQLRGDNMRVHAQVFELEATTPREAVVEGHFEEAEKLATELFEKVKQ